MRTRFVPLGVALALTWIALPPAGSAQERPADRGEAAPAAGETRPAPEQPQRGEEKPERAATPPGRGHPANRDAVIGDMKDAEVRHRERLAMIGRLRELAQAKGQTERLAALDTLEAKENAKYARHLAKQRGQLGEEQFRKVNERLGKGRGQDKARGEAKKPERPAGEAGEKDKAKEKEKAKDEKPRDKPAHAEKPARAEKPKAEKPAGADKPKADKPRNEKQPEKPKAAKARQKEKERVKQLRAERGLQKPAGGEGQGGQDQGKEPEPVPGGEPKDERQP